MADQAEEPLIGNRDGDYRSAGEEDGPDLDHSTDPNLLQEDLPTPGLFVWLLTFSAGISGLLFGCKSSLSSEGLIEDCSES
jgi:SP family myo-inositol transporter-like MFS transporter 13